MKYKFFLLLLVTAISHGQKNYTFDYLLEYEYQRTENDAVEIIYLLTNAKNNAIDASLKYFNSDYFRLFLTDDLTGIRSIAFIPCNNLENVSTINLKCADIINDRAGEVNQSKRFIFENLKDTIINTSAYKHYSMDYVSKRQRKTYKRGTRHYIVENNTEFHKPLVSFSYFYDLHVTSSNIPNGIAREMYSINDFQNNQKEYIYKLKSITEINMKMVIPKDCEKLINIK